MRPLKVLLVAEDVTLAQVVRLAALGRPLALQTNDAFEVHFACGSFDPLVFDGCNFVHHSLYTAPKSQLFQAIDQGKRPYEVATLEKYLSADLELLARVQPDVVVGDFRLSLSTAAELRGLRCGTLINAYWSPYYQRPAWPVPDHPILSWLGEKQTARFFPLAIPLVFRHFAAPLNAVRKRRGLRPVGSLLEMLTHGTETLYADDPALFSMVGLPDTHHFLGAIPWSPPGEIPEALRHRAQGARPFVYVTLGSSGRVEVLEVVLEALSGMDVDAAVATANRVSFGDLPSNVQAFPFLPGDQVGQQASVVICNGGSSTGYQAIAAGAPVLGIPSNFDQFLASRLLTSHGAALEVPARLANVKRISSALEALITDPSYKVAASRLALSALRQDSSAQFERWLRAGSSR